MNFNKFVKISIVFLIIFAWVFSGSFQIWNNPLIPPKIQEAKAIEYLDNPSFTGGTTYWTLSNMTYDSNTYQDTAGSVQVFADRKVNVTGTATQDNYDNYSSEDTVIFSGYWKNTHAGNGSIQFFAEIAEENTPNTWVTIWSTDILYASNDWTYINNVNVSGYFSTGSYRLRLRIVAAGGAGVGSSEYGWFDNLSLDVPLPNITVNTTGTQIANMTIPSSDNYVGGAFTFVSTGSQTVSEIIISETGTVNADANLSNVKLFYKQEATCSSSIPGDATAFNSTGVSFSSSKATATGTMSVGESQVCVYVQLDVGSGASADETLLIQITDPSTEVTVDTGVVSPDTAVAISGTTTLQESQPNVHIDTSGTQKETLGIPSTDNYLGGVFTFIQDETGLGSVDVTQIIITETGTVNADANLSNVKLFYKQEATCSSSIPGDATAFNSTGVSFSSSKATATGTMSVGESQVCVYVQLDVGSGASKDETLLIQISSSSDVTVSDGTVSLQSTPLAISGTTTLQVIISITVNPSSFNYGLSAAGATRRAINSAEVPDLGNYGILVTNNSAVPVDLLIYGDDATGDETWTLSAGSLQYTHEFIKLDTNGSPIGNWTALDYSANKKTLDTSVAATGTMEFDLRITTPSSSETGTIVNVPVMVLGTEAGS